MSDTLIAGILSSVATITAPLIVYVINGIVKYSKVVTFKKGDKFQGEWKFDDSDRAENDTIIVNSTRWGNIKCDGSLVLTGSAKTYKLKGRQYRHCVSFEFHGIENNRHDETVGYLIFRKNNPNNNELEGRWSQLDINGNLIGGTMKWKRIV